MSYLMQSRIVSDSQLLQRISACAATLAVPNPEQWVFDHRWELSAQDGWASAYATSWNAHHDWDEESGVPRPPAPGLDEDAITDQMILNGVDALCVPAEPEEPEEPQESEEPLEGEE